MTKLKYVYQIEAKLKTEYNKITSKLDTVDERNIKTVYKRPINLHTQQKFKVWS